MIPIRGTPGNDTLTGDDGANVFAVWQGGDDTVSGLGGNDYFIFRDTFTAADHVDGGAGFDYLQIQGPSYATGLTLGPDTMHDVEEIQFGRDFSYVVTMNDGNVAAGQTLTVNGEAANGLIFDGSAEQDGHFRFFCGHSDRLIGGQQSDVFNMHVSQAGVQGEGGNDLFVFVRPGVQIDGGSGDDGVIVQDFNGDWNSNLYTSVERLVLTSTGDGSITADDAAVPAGKVMTVIDSTQTLDLTFRYDASAETDGHYVFRPGNTFATLIGGAQSDHFTLQDFDTATNGGGKDVFVAEFEAQETFVYNAASDSTSLGYDTIRNLDFHTMHFVMPWGTMATPGQFVGGALSKASFDTTLAAAAGGGGLTAHGALVFTATGGDLSGHAFLVVDVNGVAGYQAGQDVVIDVTGWINV